MIFCPFVHNLSMSQFSACEKIAALVALTALFSEFMAAASSGATICIGCPSLASSSSVCSSPKCSMLEDAILLMQQTVDLDPDKTFEQDKPLGAQQETVSGHSASFGTPLEGEENGLGLVGARLGNAEGRGCADSRLHIFMRAIASHKAASGTGFGLLLLCAIAYTIMYLFGLWPIPSQPKFEEAFETTVGPPAQAGQLGEQTSPIPSAPAFRDEREEVMPESARGLAGEGESPRTDRPILSAERRHTSYRARDHLTDGLPPRTS